MGGRKGSSIYLRRWVGGWVGGRELRTTTVDRLTVETTSPLMMTKGLERMRPRLSISRSASPALHCID